MLVALGVLDLVAYDVEVAPSDEVEEALWYIARLNDCYPHYPV
jgi:hypothetical protein